VTTELPDFINPGISAININGAILAFEVHINNAITKSVVRSLEVAN
jgi:hypothetical protein